MHCLKSLKLSYALTIHNIVKMNKNMNKIKQKGSVGNMFLGRL